MHIFQTDDTFLISDDALIRDLDGESVILDLATEEYFSLDPVGALIWRGAEQGHTVGELVTTITSSFEVEKTKARKDTEDFLEQLLAAKLITRQTA